MIFCAFLLLTSFLAFYESLMKLSFLSILNNVKFKYTLILAFGVFTFTPLYEGFSLAVLLFSLFDAPSVFCVFLMAFFTLKIFYKDFYKKELKIRTNTLSFGLISIFCFAVYLGNLDLIPYDIYNENAFKQGIFIFIFLLALYGVDKFCAFLALLSVLFCVFSEENLIKALFDGYLWLFSLAFLLFHFFTFIKGKICKKPLK